MQLFSSSSSSTSLPASSSPKNEFVPIPVMLNRLSCFTSSSTSVPELFDFNSYSFITILNNPLQIYNFLRFIDLNDFPITLHGHLRHITHKVVSTERYNSPSWNCFITHKDSKHNGIRVTLFQALKIMLELTLFIEYRIALNTSIIDLARYSQGNNPGKIYLDLHETCGALAPWLRLIRINGQDLIPMIRSKTSWLSNSLSKYVVGLYNTDTTLLLKEQRNTAKIKEYSGLYIDPNHIMNEFEFTNERLAHLVVQLCLPLVYSSFNPINMLQCIVLYLKNDYSMIQTIQTKYGTITAVDPLQYITTLKSLSVFDRLIACKYLSLDRLPVSYTHSHGPSHGPKHGGSMFLKGVQFFSNLDELLPILIMYGNYAVAAAYQKENHLFFALQYYLFVPNTTSLEVEQYVYINDKKFVYDVQWCNGIQGCIVPVFMLHDKEITRSNMVRLYSNGDKGQPNFLLAIMSWFANDKDFVPISQELTEAEKQDLDAFAHDNMVIMNQLYHCWEFKVEYDTTGTGKQLKRPPLPKEYKHDWKVLKKWLLCVGETIRVFVRCLLREKERVFTAGGIFQDSVAYYSKSCDGGTWESQDTEVLIKLMRFVSHLYGATKMAYKQYYYNQNATEQDKQEAWRHLLRVLYCFYVDDLDILDLNDTSTYYSDGVGDLAGNIQGIFTDKRCMVQPTDEQQQQQQEEEEEDYEVDGWRVKDRWALVRNALCLVLGGGQDGEEIKRWTGKCVPFIVFDQGSRHAGTAPIVLGSPQTASLVIDCFPCVKAKDVSQLMTSIIRNDIHIDTTHVKPFLLRVFTNTARQHILEPPRQQQQQQQQSHGLSSSKRHIQSYDNLVSNSKRHRSSFTLSSSQESETGALVEEELEPEAEDLLEYDPDKPEMNGGNDTTTTTTTTSSSIPVLTSRIQGYGRGLSRASSIL